MAIPPEVADSTLTGAVVVAALGLVRAAERLIDKRKNGGATAQFSAADRERLIRSELYLKDIRDDIRHIRNS